MLAVPRMYAVLNGHSTARTGSGHLERQPVLVMNDDHVPVLYCNGAFCDRLDLVCIAPIHSMSASLKL
jgi:hypothetical protein